MSADPDSEQPRPLADGEGDAVTFAFGDAAAGLFGVARLGRAAPSPGADGATASGLAILFAGGEVITARAEGAAPVAGPRWEDVRAAGLRTTIDEPLQTWSVTLDVEDGIGMDVRFTALAPPAVIEPDHPVARTGGMQGYESYCRVRGTVTVEGTPRPVNGLGQRSHSWGAPDWDRLTIARTLGVWLDDHTAISISAVRDQAAREHDGEHIAAFVIEPDEEGPAGPVPHAVDEALLSTTYDATGCQRGAGLELYVTENGYARRAAGEVVCGTTLDLGRLRLDCAFFRWRLEGREGYGRYDVLRRA